MPQELRIETAGALWAIAQCPQGWEQGDKGVRITPRIVRKLYHLGWLERQPARPDSDPRTHRWTITEQGQHVLDERMNAEGTRLRFTLPNTTEAHTR